MSFKKAIRTFNVLGTGFMMNPAAGAAGEKIGLDFLEFYALGRGGVLGDVDGSVVADAFYFFNPELVTKTWNAAKAKVAPTDAATAYAEACAAWGRDTLAGVDGLPDFCDLADTVTAAAEPTPSAVLFDGWRKMPLPDDPPGRAALHITLVLRELRGGAHIDAIKKVGLSPFIAVACNTPYMLKVFGWADDAPDTAQYAEQIKQAELLTDDLLNPAFAVLSEAEQARFANSLDAIRAKIGN